MEFDSGIWLETLASSYEFTEFLLYTPLNRTAAHLYRILLHALPAISCILLVKMLGYNLFCKYQRIWNISM